MATNIKTWEILNGQPRAVESSLEDYGRKEALDLETWISNDPSIVRSGLQIIGRQVYTRSGPLDLLGIDSSGDLYVIELKRDRLPRESLAQAIDYASDIRSWSVDRLSEICEAHTHQSLEDFFNDAFPDTDIESVTINESQRILLVGFSLDSALERMIEWLSDQYGVGINAVILKYVHTAAGGEFLATTSILSEETEEVRVRKKKFPIAKSDEPGHYSESDLKERLIGYLSQPGVVATRFRKMLLPSCLARSVVTREELKQELIARNMDPSKAGLSLAGLSLALSSPKNDFLRQVLSYEYPKYPHEKDNFRIKSEYRPLVEEVLSVLDQTH